MASGEPQAIATARSTAGNAAEQASGATALAGAVTAWLGRPAGRWAAVLLGVLILALPALLLADQIHPFFLFNDDFDFIVQSRDWSITRDTLLVPHEAHVVPLFRLWTFALVQLAGTLANLPAILCGAAYLALVVAMLLVGMLTTRESNQTAVGLVAMAGVGLTTVMEPAVRWYSAGQPLCAAGAVVLTVVLTRAWCLRGGWARLGAAALASLAAPALWTGGIVAGPAGIAYLLAKRSHRRRDLSLAMALAAVTGSFALLLFVLTRRHIRENTVIWQEHAELWPRPIQALLHVAQAIAENLIMGNLGLDVTMTSFQAIGLMLGLAGTWLWSRGGRRPLNSLEASGATIILGSYLLIYAFRGNQPYVSLRAAGWYHVIAQVGVPIFASGWWMQLRPPGAAQAPAEAAHCSGRLTRKQAAVVLGLVAVLYFMQAPRALSILLRTAPPLTRSEQRKFPIPGLRRFRAIYFRQQAHELQVRALSRIDRAQPIAERLGASREALRRTFGQLIIPGTFAGQDTCDMVGLLMLPERSAHPEAGLDPARLRDALGHLLVTEREPRPAWLDRNEPWPPPTP